MWLVDGEAGEIKVAESAGVRRDILRDRRISVRDRASLAARGVRTRAAAVVPHGRAAGRAPHRAAAGAGVRRPPPPAAGGARPPPRRGGARPARRAAPPKPSAADG